MTWKHWFHEVFCRIKVENNEIASFLLSRGQLADHDQFAGILPAYSRISGEQLRTKRSREESSLGPFSNNYNQITNGLQTYHKHITNRLKTDYNFGFDRLLTDNKQITHRLWADYKQTKGRLQNFV